MSDDDAKGRELVLRSARVASGSDSDGGARDLAIRSAAPARGARATVTRADLAASLYRQFGLSRDEAASLVEAILEEISRALIDGGEVKLSSFGNLSVRRKKARMGRNPKTREEVPIPPRKVLVFRASRILKGRMNCRPRASRAGKPE